MFGMEPPAKRQIVSAPGSAPAISNILTAPPSESGIPVTTGIVTASANSPLTTATVTDISVSNGVTSTVTFVTTVTDASVFSSLQSQQATATSNSGVSASNTAGPSTSSSAASNTNLAVLIPAVVVPVAVVLILSFLGFWWFMRKRARAALRREPEFLMEKRSSHSRDGSTHSQSSTRKLVSKSDISKQTPLLQVSEFDGDHVDGPNHGAHSGAGAAASLPAVGVAASTPGHSRQTSVDQSSGTKPAIRNFSRGPQRPSTATNEGNPPAQQFTRDRSASNPAPRSGPGMPKGSSVSVNRSDPRGPAPPRAPGPRGPPPSNMRGGQPRGPPPVGPPPPRGTQARPSFDRQHPPLSGAPGRGPPPPSALATRGPPSSSKQQAAPPSNDPPTPTGAYNGATSISKYSPIIQDAPKFGTGLPGGKAGENAGSAESGLRKPPPQPLTTTIPQSPLNADFSEENMRIARLANSSRLGFHLGGAPGADAKDSEINKDGAEPQNPSPRLPPPATREAPPARLGVPFPAPPPEPVDTRTRSFLNDRRSMVSRVSTDDGYVDAEVDNKSDVSSLDEREKWHLTEEQRTESRQAGGLALASHLAKPSVMQSPGLLSEASASNYSLGGSSNR